MCLLPVRLRRHRPSANEPIKKFSAVDHKNSRCLSFCLFVFLSFYLFCSLPAHERALFSSALVHSRAPVVSLSHRLILATMASRRGTAPPLSCPASSFLLNPPPSPWVSSARSGPPLADATRASASAISSSSKLEREHYLRQNRDISRLCSIKSAQIRQFEAKLSKLERENLGMRIALREAENGLAARDRAQAARLSSASSTSTSLSDLQDADAQGREAEVVIPKPAQGRQTSDAILLGEIESAEDDSCSSSDDTRRRKRRRLSRRASPFGPKTILLSKLNQVQVIYQVWPG